MIGLSDSVDGPQTGLTRKKESGGIQILHEKEAIKYDVYNQRIKTAWRED